LPAVRVDASRPVDARVRARDGRGHAPRRGSTPSPRLPRSPSTISNASRLSFRSGRGTPPRLRSTTRRVRYRTVGLDGSGGGSTGSGSSGMGSGGAGGCPGSGSVGGTGGCGSIGSGFSGGGFGCWTDRRVITGAPSSRTAGTSVPAERRCETGGGRRRLVRGPVGYTTDRRFQTSQEVAMFRHQQLEGVSGVALGLVLGRPGASA
jgi:hypothetical protein